jgi:uncharacterized membrane protein HdeD (DUF308 family)
MGNNQRTTIIPTKAGKMGRHKKLGVASIILGLAAISATLLNGPSFAMVVGILVIAAGILRMIWAFSDRSFGRGLLVFALGGHTLMSGVTLLGNPFMASALLNALVAVFLFADGATEIVGAFRVPRESGRRWMLVGGTCALILSAMIWRQFPLSGTWSLGVLLGIRLIFIGVVMLTRKSAVRSSVKVAGEARGPAAV